MASKAKQSAQVKGRQTKLEKKSHEELVAIILKKDKVERNLNSQVVNLKAEVNTLGARVDNFDKDQEGNIKAIADWKSKYEEKCNLVDTLNEKCNARANEAYDFKSKYEEKCKVEVELNEKCKSLTKIAWTFGIAFVVCLIGWLFC